MPMSTFPAQMIRTFHQAPNISVHKFCSPSQLSKPFGQFLDSIQRQGHRHSPRGLEAPCPVSIQNAQTELKTPVRQRLYSHDVLLGLLNPIRPLRPQSLVTAAALTTNTSPFKLAKNTAPFSRAPYIIYHRFRNTRPRVFISPNSFTCGGPDAAIANAEPPCD